MPNLIMPELREIWKRLSGQSKHHLLRKRCTAMASTTECARCRSLYGKGGGCRVISFFPSLPFYHLRSCQTLDVTSPKKFSTDLNGTYVQLQFWIFTQLSLFLFQILLKQKIGFWCIQKSIIISGNKIYKTGQWMVTISTLDLSIWHCITYYGVIRTVLCDARKRDVVYIEQYYDGADEHLLKQAMMNASVGSVGAVEGCRSNKSSL